MCGATFPAQAILFSRVLNVFLLTGQEAQDEANFYSLMFFIVALGNLLAYFVIGWTWYAFASRIFTQLLTHL